MKINDYILKEDILQLTKEEYEGFRNYLRFIGFQISEQYGKAEDLFNDYRNQVVILYDDGDLVWSHRISRGDRITVEEVRRMASLTMQ